MFIAPSISPWRARLGDTKGVAHNPGLRKYTYLKSDYKLKDIEQYYLRLEKVQSYYSIKIDK